MVVWSPSKYEPRGEKTGLPGFPTRSDTNRPIQSQGKVRILKFWAEVNKGIVRTIRVAKTKALISCAVTAQLICAFVFAYAKSGFLMTRLICFIL